MRQVHIAIPAAAGATLGRAKVYLLISGHTASAAEHLSLSLKRTHRATLIGEATCGAGHFGGFEQLPGGYAAFIPVGRTFDPDTGQSWEGNGVKPDVAVTADKALDEALRRAGIAASGATALVGLSDRIGPSRSRGLARHCENLASRGPNMRPKCAANRVKVDSPMTFFRRMSC